VADKYIGTCQQVPNPQVQVQVQVPSTTSLDWGALVSVRYSLTCVKC